MTDAEMDAWDAMLDALHCCAAALSVGDGVLTEVKSAIALAEKAREPEAA